MKPRHLLGLWRAAIVTGVLGSAALESDYRNMGDPAFCGLDSPCFRLRTSDVGQTIAGYLSPVSLPQVALMALLVLLVFSFFLGTRTHLLLLSAATAVGGLFALFLIVIQARMKTICPYCMLVDSSMLVAAVTIPELLRRIRTKAQFDANFLVKGPPTRSLAWSMAAAFAVGGPYFWAQHLKPAPLPASIAALQEPGKVTVVSFTDFECPYCRRTHPALTLVHLRPDVSFKRMMAPLSFHPHALPAAMGYLCVAPEHKGDFADLLYQVDPETMTGDGVVNLAAEKFGEDKVALKACMQSDESKTELLRQMQIFDDLGNAALPTTYVGPYLIVGAQPEKIVAAVDLAKSPPFALPLWGLFVASGLLTLIALVMSFRQLPPADNLSERATT